MGSGHDHSHNQPVGMVAGDDGQGGYQPPNNLDFDALSGYYTDQIARLTQQSAMLVGQLSGAKQECARLNDELVKANDELHKLKSGEKSDDWKELPDVGPES